MSLFGYTTKKDLSGMGRFLFMGVIGLIVAMIINWFTQSAGLEFAINVLGVLIFAGLTAYDTQNIKNTYVSIRSAPYGEEIAANSCAIDANFGKVLRTSDRWMRAFSASHAPATRRRNSETSQCFCSDAGRSFGALRVDRAENLQRIRA